MRKSAWFSAVTALVVGLVLGLSTVTVTAQAAADKGAKHTHMEQAMKNINQAQEQLDKAAHDYDGHRGKAVKLLKQAEQEIKDGIAMDDKKAAAPKAAPKK